MAIGSSPSGGFPHVAASAGTDAILKALYDAGGVIIEGLLGPDQVVSMNKELDGPLDALEPGSTHNSDMINSFHGNNTKRLAGLPTCSKTFREYLLDHDVCQDILERIFHPQTRTYWLQPPRSSKLTREQRTGPPSRSRAVPSLQSDGAFCPRSHGQFPRRLDRFHRREWRDSRHPRFAQVAGLLGEGRPEGTIPAIMKAGGCVLFFSERPCMDTEQTAPCRRSVAALPMHSSVLVDARGSLCSCDIEGDRWHFEPAGSAHAWLPVTISQE